MKGAVVEFTVPTMLEYVLGVEFVPEAEDTVRMGFGGVKIVLGTFEGSELFNRKVFREVFDREAGKIIGHSMCSWSVDCVPFNSFILVADCSPFVYW